MRSEDDTGAGAPAVLDAALAATLALRGRWRTLVLAVACGAALGAGAGRLLPRWYAASAEFATVPGDDPTRNAEISGLEGAGVALPLFAQVLRSHQVLDDVAGRLGLAQVYGGGAPEDLRRALLSHLSVSMDRKIGTLRLTVEDRSPERARQLAATLGEVAMARNGDIWAGRAREHRRRLEARRDEVAAALGKAEDAMRRFRERERVVNLEEQTRASLGEATLLERARIEKRVGLQVAQSYAGERSAEVQRGQLEAVGIQAALQKIGGERRGPLLPLEELPRLEVEHARLKREIDLRAASLDLVARQIEQLRTLEARPVGRPEIIDPPTLPQRPVRPSGALLSAAGALLGLLLATLLIARSSAQGLWRSLLRGARATPGT